LVRRDPGGHAGRPQVLWSLAVVLIAAFVRHGRARASEPVMADMH
jgi:hypothetical protein